MKNRLKLNDNAMTSTVKMAGGNMGAMRVCIELIKHGGTIDSHCFAGGLGILMLMDTFTIYEEYIWMLYKDVCEGSLVKTVAMLRAVQMGILPEKDLHHAIENMGEGIDVEDLLKQVSERVPDFNINIEI